MPLGNLNPPLAPDDLGLPDWLAGSDPLSDSGAPLAGFLDFNLDLSGTDGSSMSQRTPIPAECAEPPAPPRAEPSPAPALAPTPAPAPNADGWQFARWDVPHNTADAPDARSYRFYVSNTTAHALECAVEFALPPGCRGVRASGSPKRTKAGLEWNLGALVPGAGTWLSVRLPLTAPAAPLKHSPASVRIASRRATPLLAVSAEAPAEVRGGVPVPVASVLTNPGRVPLAGGTLTVTGADGTALGETAFPPLAPGSEFRAELALPPQPAGPARCLVTATAPGAEPAHAPVEFRTDFATLTAALTTPPRVDLNDEFGCRLEITNTAHVPADGVRVSVSVPEELVFRGATAGGTLSASGAQVEWVIDHLPAQGTWETTARFAGFAPGGARLRVVMSGPGARGAFADARVECVLRRGAGATTLAEVLAEIALPASSPDDVGAHVAPRETGTRHLVVRTADIRLAVPLESVRDVMRPLPLTALPGTPDWVAGVANVRGDIVTVIDLAAFLELGEPAARRGLVIVQGNDGCVLGALVDEITGIRAVTDDAESPIDNRLAQFLAGVGADPSGLVHRLSVANLLTALETELGAPVGLS